jgi:hypothetical protein
MTMQIQDKWQSRHSTRGSSDATQKIIQTQGKWQSRYEAHLNPDTKQRTVQIQDKVYLRDMTNGIIHVQGI